LEAEPLNSGTEFELSTAQSGADSSATTLPKRDHSVNSSKVEETEYEN